MQTSNSHIHIDANSPMLKEGIVSNTNRGHYEGGGEDRRRRPRRVVEEEGMSVSGVERDVSPAVSRGKY